MARVTSDEAPVREILTYGELFGTAVRELAQQVVDDGYEPDVVLAIARGGLGVAVGMGYAFAVKNLFAVNVEFYTGVDERLDMPACCRPPRPRSTYRPEGADRRRVADTGKTLESYATGGRPRGRSPHRVMYQKPWTMIAAEYVWRRTERWIDFP